MSFFFNFGIEFRLIKTKNLLEASGWETRGFLFYREFNNRNLRGVLRGGKAYNKSIILLVEK